MKVLVTGSTGFLGSEVVRLLRQQDVEVFAVARRHSPSTVNCELNDLEFVFRLLEDAHPDAIINCAAQVDWGQNRLSELFTVNALVPGIMADWCKSNGAYLLQVSGTLVYGSVATHVDQSLTEAPDTDYGRSKLLADQMIQASGASAGIIRFGGIFGKDGPEHLGINRAIRLARSGELPTLTGKGNARRNYIHVTDAAERLVFCVLNRLQGIHLAGGSQVLSIADMLQQICDVYLEGKQPIVIDGNEALDQVIIGSSALPGGHPFKESLLIEL